MSCVTVPAEGGLFLLVARGSEGPVRPVGEHLEREAFALGTGTGRPVPGVGSHDRPSGVQSLEKPFVRIGETMAFFTFFLFLGIFGL